MTRRRRLLLLGSVVIASCALGGLFLVHSDGVQRWAWTEVTTVVAERTGVGLEADQIELRLLPARAELKGLSLSSEDGVFCRVGRVELRWRWRHLLADVPRLQELVIEDPWVDSTRLPSAGESQDTPPADPADALRAVEVDTLVLTEGEAVGDLPALRWSLEGLSLRASLASGVAKVELLATAFEAVRQGRALKLGPLELSLRAGADGLAWEQLELQGQAVRVELGEGRMAWDGSRLASDLGLRLDPAALLGWWDPQLLSGLQVAGALRLEGAVADAEAGPELHLRHVGPPLVLNGWQLATLELDGSLEKATLQMGAPEWGSARARWLRDAELALDLDLLEAPVGRLAELVPVGVGLQVPADLKASGRVAGRWPAPFEPLPARAESELQLAWGGGGAELELDREGELIHIQRCAVTLPGAAAQLNGSLNPGTSVDLRAEVDVTGVPDLLSELRRWWPDLPEVAVAGGPLRVEGRVTGVMASPKVRAELLWSEPSYDGVQLAEAVATATVVDGVASWQGRVEAVRGSFVEAVGETRLDDLGTRLRWQLRSDELGSVQGVLPDLVPEDLHGAVTGAGKASWSRAGWDFEAEVDGEDVGLGEWHSESVHARLSAAPDRLDLSQLRLRALGAVVEASCSVPLTTRDEPVWAEVALSGLRPEALPLELPPQLQGAADGSLRIGGTLENPTAEAELSWRSGEEQALVRSVRAHAVLEDGVLRLVVPEALTAAGPVTATGRLPLAALPRPEWLWPGLVGEALELEVDGVGLRAAPLLMALGLLHDPQLDLTADLSGKVHWNLLDEDDRSAILEFDRVVLETELETLRAEEPLRFAFSDGTLRLDPFAMYGTGSGQAMEPLQGSGTSTLEMRAGELSLEEMALRGARSQVRLGGTYDLDSGQLQATADVVLDSSVARLVPLPVPLRMQGPVRLRLEAGGVAGDLNGTLKLSHRGGTIIMRDPALEIRDLELEAEVVNGAVAIREGRATVNRGEVVIGGGWDPEVGQGIVIELDEVAFLLPYGILSRWDGTLALEPHPRELVRVVGDLQLEGGVWDRPFDYAGAFFGSSLGVSTADDPLQEVGLDVEVRGRRGISVNNNLGTFKVNWDLLHVGGNAAEPALQGMLRIEEGGVLNLAGSAVELRRGTVEFSGDPGMSPRLEIVPVNDVATSGGPIDVSQMATQTLARGLGNALGLENETLRPAEIAIETESDVANRFSVGQRLSRYLALIVTTNLSDVQDVKTLLQLWNIPGLRGLAVQVFQETADEVAGGAVFERLRWGGSPESTEAAHIQKIRLRGDWPLSKRRLKRAAGVRKGQPYDPFMLFAARVRMEQELAEAGYYDALVEAEAEGSELLPMLVFECEPGPRQRIVFDGDEPSKSVRRQVRASYQAPPLEKAALETMAATLERYWASEGYPDATVATERRGDVLVMHSARGPRRELVGPVTEGVPPAAQQRLQALLAAPAELNMVLDRPEWAKNVVQRVLRETGYRAFGEITISAEQLDEATTRVKITTAPGPPERIAGISLAGRDPLAILDSSQLPIGEGMVLDQGQVDRTVFWIRREYRGAGYPDVEVDAWLEESSADEWTVWFELDPGPQRTIDAIELHGLRHLSEKVLRRNLGVAEGDLMRLTELDEAAARLAGFAPVERVDVSTRASSAAGTTVEIEVQEADRWTVGLGARWRSDRGLEALLDLRDDNLFHRGVSLNLRGRWEQEEKQLILIGGIPALPGGRRSILLKLDYFQGPPKGAESSVATETVYGATFELNYELSSSSSVRNYYRFEDTTVENPYDFYGGTQLQVGTIGGLFIHDRLDDPFDPRSGYYAAVDLSWSSSYWGSDLDTVKTVFTGALAMTPREGWTWNQSLRLGLAEALQGTELDAKLKFFAGGQASVRGFERDSVGPLVPSAGGLVGAGGGALFVLNEELRIPIWNGLRLAVFTDVGQVWEDWGSVDTNVSVGAGIGLRYATPIGPLWADIAWPVAEKGISEGYKIYFGIGRPF